MAEKKVLEKKALDEATLQEIVRRIVQVAQPEKIILFGSAARGEMGPHSDVDLLVIKSGVHQTGDADLQEHDGSGIRGRCDRRHTPGHRALRQLSGAHH